MNDNNNQNSHVLRLKIEKDMLRKQNDVINNPKHYTSGKIECIDAVESAIQDLQGIEAFCTGNAIKYLWRWHDKNGKQDLEKAQWYINKLINLQE